jgi:hypothetical protein
MKQYAPKRILPNTHQFYSFVREKVSEQGLQSLAGIAVRHLFQTAESLYNTLAFHTSEQLSVFVDAGHYLTPLQEHDLVALTASYIPLFSHSCWRKSETPNIRSYNAHAPAALVRANEGCSFYPTKVTKEGYSTFRNDMGQFLQK